MPTISCVLLSRDTHLHQAVNNFQPTTNPRPIQPTGHASAMPSFLLWCVANSLQWVNCLHLPSITASGILTHIISINFLWLSHRLTPPRFLAVWSVRCILCALCAGPFHVLCSTKKNNQLNSQVLQHYGHVETGFSDLLSNRRYRIIHPHLIVEKLFFQVPFLPKFWVGALPNVEIHRGEGLEGVGTSS